MLRQEPGGIPSSGIAWASNHRCLQAMRLFPRTAGERTKAAIRMSKPPVPSGRPVLRVTMQRRTQLPNEFFMWATEQGPDIAALFEHHQRHIDDINLVV